MKETPSTKHLLKWNWAQIAKPLRSPGIDFKESIPPAYVAWLAGTTNKDVVPGRQASQARGIDSLESIPGLIKS